MKNFSFTLFFWQISRIVLTILLLASLALFYIVYTMEPSAAVHIYHSCPVMLEHILAGMLLYLAFSLIITKIHHASLHDRKD